MKSSRRFPIGAEPNRGEGTHFRVWAPDRLSVEVVEQSAGLSATGQAHTLAAEGDGYFSGSVSSMVPGDRYAYRLDRQNEVYPDPASRFQPEGPHGPSEIVDGTAYVWGDSAFRGPPLKSQVIYEMHVGTFTPEGTYAAAMAELAELRRLGITTLELMPIADFPGRFGWGYDGVDLWAPTRLYGAPDDLRRFIDHAHQNEIAVLLDVVYNHLGPDGNYLKQFSKDYFSDRYQNEWGEPINFDGKNKGPVREFFVENARYWVEEYHFDGLRLDATQSLFDASPRHVIADITQAARAGAEKRQTRVFIAAENEPQASKLARPVDRGGYGCDALWNDDFHHTARVALTGRNEAYYSDYRGTPQEFISALRWGYLYQGQHYFWQGNRRGQPALNLCAQNFITYIQNHDQVANSLSGARIHELTSPAKLRAMTVLLLLGPSTPMLFQGQEFAASTPFLYFADQSSELAQLIRRDRQKFLSQFPSIASNVVGERLFDPSDFETFARCKLDFSERQKHASAYHLHRDLLALRAVDPAFSEPQSDRIHGAVLSASALLLRYFCDQGDRLVIVNFGSDLELSPAPEPLLAPPEDAEWKLLFCSEEPKYGGQGFRTPFADGVWSLTANSATVFAATRVEAEA